MRVTGLEEISDRERRANRRPTLKLYDCWARKLGLVDLVLGLGSIVGRDREECVID